MSLVKHILEHDPKARNSDSYLYMKIIEIKAQGWEMPLCNVSVMYFLQNMKMLDVPPFESVRRARQKIQAKYPDLAACKEVREGRMEKEEAYYQFAKMEV